MSAPTPCQPFLLPWLGCRAKRCDATRRPRSASTVREYRYRHSREDAGFSQTVRAALAKNGPVSGMSSAERDLAVQQNGHRVAVPTERVDILEVGDLDAQGISILPGAFLSEVQGME